MNHRLNACAYLVVVLVLDLQLDLVVTAPLVLGFWLLAFAAFIGGSAVADRCVPV